LSLLRRSYRPPDLLVESPAFLLVQIVALVILHKVEHRGVDDDGPVAASLPFARRRFMLGS